MSIQSLVAVLTPPEAPADAEVGSVREISEERRQLKLPDDFWKFICVYGSGTINNFINVLNPISRNSALNLWIQMEEALAAHRAIREKYPEMFPFKLFPEAGGLLPFGSTANGDELLWKTAGPPDAWNIVFFDRGRQEFKQYPYNLTGFLSAILRSPGAFGDILPLDFEKTPPSFVPLSPIGSGRNTDDRGSPNSIGPTKAEGPSLFD